MHLSSKILTTLVAALLLLADWGGEAAACGRKTPADRMRSRLEKVQRDGKTIFGHDDDTAYGHNWWGFSGRSDVMTVAGDYPGLMNWDLGMIELDSAANLDGVDFKGMAREIAAQHRRGGVSALSWHPRNPVTGGDSWDTGGGDVVAQILAPGSEANLRFAAYLDRVADFIASIRDAKGNRVPVIFRPWHEHTGSWFWWGKDLTSAENYVKLWEMTRAAFDAKGIDNVLWAYSPDKVTTTEDYMERYPGDRLVDIFGADIYHLGGEQATPRFFELIKGSMTVARDEALKRGKLWALTETGCEALEVPDWYNAVLARALDGFRPLYLCVWRNALQEGSSPYVRKGHYYTPWPGHPQEKSFVDYCRRPEILLARDLRNY